MDYKKLLQTSEYDFLRTNPYLGNHILLLTLGGSRAYGTNLPTSDVDIRGIAATPMSALFGLEKDFEQVVETNTDTVIYSMQRLYLMGKDLNASGQIITYREKEHDILMSIRNGEYMSEDGKKVRPEFYDLLKSVQDEYIYAVKHTVLPERANMESLQEMMFGIYEKQFDRYKKKDFYNYLDQL